MRIKYFVISRLQFVKLHTSTVLRRHNDNTWPKRNNQSRVSFRFPFSLLFGAWKKSCLRSELIQFGSALLLPISLCFSDKKSYLQITKNRLCLYHFRDFSSRIFSKDQPFRSLFVLSVQQKSWIGEEVYPTFWHFLQKVCCFTGNDGVSAKFNESLLPWYFILVDLPSTFHRYSFLIPRFPDSYKKCRLPKWIIPKKLL